MIVTFTASNQVPVDTQTICRPSHQSNKTNRKTNGQNFFKNMEKEIQSKEEYVTQQKEFSFLTAGGTT
jgi:hypothetical protein